MDFGKVENEVKEKMEQDCMGTVKQVKNELIEDVEQLEEQAAAKKKFACDLCGKRFQRHDHMIQHREFVHEGIKRFGCPICDKFFSRKENVANHIKVVHEKRKDFQCEICGKYLISKFSLENHRRTHTGEKPFACDVCGAKFADPSALIGHKKIHSDSPKVMIKCPFCESEFSKKWNLDIHIQNKHSGKEQLPSNAYTEEAKMAAVAMADKVMDVLSKCKIHDKDYLRTMKFYLVLI